MIVRELFALMGIQTDMGSVQKAENAIDGVKKAAASLGALFFTGIVARALDKFTRQAADVAETTALLDTVFKENSGAVQEWASKTAGFVGRSEFKLREFAAEIGAIAAPMLGTGEATAKLSTDMAQLAVDLASVFNTADKDAIVALRSGLLGESEPMRRFGVNLLDSSLEVFATSIGKTFKGMKEAEKMHLRYQFILKQTALFQGNANRELESFTNSSKYLSDRLGDVGIRIGQALLPGMTKLVHLAIAGVDGFMKLAHGSKIIEAALIALQVATAAVAVWMVLPFLPAIATFLAIAAAIGLVVIAAEDLYQFFNGGLSVTGEVLKRLGVDGDRVREIFSTIGRIGKRAWEGITDAVGRLAAHFMSLSGDTLPSVEQVLEWLGKKFNEFLTWVEPKLDALLTFDWQAKKKEIGEFFDYWSARITDFLGSPAGRALVALLGAWAGEKVGSGTGDFLGSSLGGWLGGKIGGGPLQTKWGTAIGNSVGTWIGSKLGGFGGGAAGVITGGVEGFNAFAPSTSVPAAGAGNAVSFTQQSNITVNGNASEMDKDQFRQIVEEANERAARDLHSALVPMFSEE